MSETTRVGRNASLQDLIHLNLSMKKGDRLRGTPSTLYHEAKNDFNDSKVGFLRANSYADAKKLVYDIVAREVGSGDAERIMAKVLAKNARRDGWQRFWFPNKTAMDKEQLVSVIEETIKALPTSKRTNIAGKLATKSDDHLATCMNDPVVGAIIHQRAEQEYCRENPKFIGAVYDFQTEVQDLQRIAQSKDVQFKDGKWTGGDQKTIAELTNRLAGIRKKASAVRETYVRTEAVSEVNLSSKVSQKIKKFNIDQATPGELQKLYTGALHEITSLLRRGPIGEIKTKWLANDREVTVESESLHNRPLAVLNDVRSALGPDDHLRQYDHSGSTPILYTKSNHPGSKLDPFNHGSTFGLPARAQKTESAKKTVEKLLKMHFLNNREKYISKEDENQERASGGLARSIMRPYLLNNRALSSQDLGKIMEQVNALQHTQITPHTKNPTLTSPPRPTND